MNLKQTTPVPTPGGRIAAGHGGQVIQGVAEGHVVSHRALLQLGQLVTLVTREVVTHVTLENHRHKVGVCRRRLRHMPGKKQ